MMLDHYVLSVAPTTLPVLLCDVKSWGRITWDTDDTMLESLMLAATQKAEQFTNRVFIQRTFTGYFECLECPHGYEKGYYLALRRAPIVSVTTVKVYEDDILETISSDDYDLKPTAGFSRIIFSEINNSPDTVPYPYQVEFVAGYGTKTTDVPEPIKLAIKQTVSYWYQNRGDCDCGSEMPGTAKEILGEYRILNTYG